VVLCPCKKRALYFNHDATFSVPSFFPPTHYEIQGDATLQPLTRPFPKCWLYQADDYFFRRDAICTRDDAYGELALSDLWERRRKPLPAGRIMSANANWMSRSQRRLRRSDFTKQRHLHDRLHSYTLLHRGQCFNSRPSIFVSLAGSWIVASFQPSNSQSHSCLRYQLHAN
jgi:hypothetical protein